MMESDNTIQSDQAVDGGSHMLIETPLPAQDTLDVGTEASDGEREREQGRRPTS
jgi:hypothetical protein